MSTANTSASPLTIASYTTPGLLLPQLTQHEPAAVIAELAAALQREGRLENAATFCATVVQNERQRSTAMPPAWALPHARIPGLPQLSFALGRSVVPIEWFGEGTERVHMVFLFAVPETAAANYLTLVSGLAKLNQDPKMIEKLFCAPDSQAMFEVLQKLKLRQPKAAAAKRGSVERGASEHSSDTPPASAPTL